MSEVLELLERVEKLEKQVALRHLPNHAHMTADEVAEALGVSAATVQKHVREGLLIAEFPNAKKAFRREDVERFMRGMAPARQLKAKKNAIL